MSALRCASKVRHIINAPKSNSTFSVFGELATSRNVSTTMVRHSSYQSSEILTPEQQERIALKNIEILKSPPEWKFVQRLLGQNIVKDPPPASDQYMPSGWRPQQPVAELRKKYPYFVNRTKNHQVPVYLLSTFRGQRKITKIKRIEGDIWALETELKNMLEKKLSKRVETRVNEVSGQIEFKGIHLDLADHLMDMGF